MKPNTKSNQIPGKHKDKTFEHTMLMSGGGSRFGYYLGMYAAAIDSNKHPDAIFATCGGAIAAGIIGSFNSIEEQKEALLSHELHQMSQRIQCNRRHSLIKLFLDLGKRYLHRKATDIFPDLHHDAIFTIDDETKPLFPFIPNYASNSCTIAIIGSKLCFNESQVGTKRHSSPLFEEVVFSNNKGISALSKAPYTPHSSLIKNVFKKEDSVSFQNAIRISVSDIYYLPPYSVAGNNYMGGMLDLVPFHLAQHCSTMLSLEEKQPFSSFSAIPAFLHLLGYNPNDVQQTIPRRAQDIWIDTADSPKRLKAHQINKKIQCLSNQIELETPSYDQFRTMMQAQWDYGYHKASMAFNQHKK
ncbi:patatin-like phospholipase family protein [Aliivibrio sp. 1S128]|uniref:patatin-like phospholipase family protein n=1 Tax=Aliivibrio sp. 1S128 TaxID=1840085 RepID=UPI00080ECB81|nr:patatin-like phospholipase family protein [Aliivibrio sp. 1S128]OCH23483.1 hypothetical protein A6E03_07440 [Aliivibrio sp. 1S128]